MPMKVHKPHHLIAKIGQRADDFFPEIGFL